jgi:two-component system response regulator CpxR
MHVSNLRKKLGSEHMGTERIKTVRGVGYIYTLPPSSEGTEGSTAGAL